MRQVDRDELAYVIAAALRSAAPSLLAMLVDRRPDQARRGRALVALAIADALGRYEVLCERPLPALMGESTYAVPIARMLGEDLPSGVVPARDEADRARDQ